MGSVDAISDAVKDCSFSNELSSTVAASHASKFLPVPNPLESFWQQEIHELHDHRSTEQIPEHSDIVIIGAGYAGVSTAYHLTKDPSIAGKSITILEARGACSSATGRNGGHLRPDLYGHIPTYVDRAGPEAGAEIAEFEIAHIHAIKKLIEEEKIDCDFTLTRSIDVWCNEEAARNAKTVFDQIRAHKFEYMNDAIFYTGKDVEGVRENTLLNIYIRLTVIGLRSKRCCCMRILYCWNYLAVQIHYAPRQVNPLYGHSQPADAYTSSINNTGS